MSVSISTDTNNSIEGDESTLNDEISLSTDAVNMINNFVNDFDVNRNVTPMDSESLSQHNYQSNLIGMSSNVSISSSINNSNSNNSNNHNHNNTYNYNSTINNNIETENRLIDLERKVIDLEKQLALAEEERDALLDELDDIKKVIAPLELPLSSSVGNIKINDNKNDNHNGSSNINTVIKSASLAMAGLVDLMSQEDKKATSIRKFRQAQMQGILNILAMQKTDCDYDDDIEVNSNNFRKNDTNTIENSKVNLKDKVEEMSSTPSKLNKSSSSSSSSSSFHQDEVNTPPSRLSISSSRRSDNGTPIVRIDMNLELEDDHEYDDDYDHQGHGGITHAYSNGYSDSHGGIQHDERDSDDEH